MSSNTKRKPKEHMVRSMDLGTNDYTACGRFLPRTRVHLPSYFASRPYRDCCAVCASVFNKDKA